MKISRILLTAVLTLVLLIGTVACTLLTTTYTEELETNIYAYLNEKYPDLEFEIKSYTQDTYTSGKYVFRVFCKTTEIDFEIHQSSFLTTDSYTVTYANLEIEKMFLTFFGDSLSEARIQSIQWLDLYADGSTGYKFRDVDLSQLPHSVSEVKNIYRISLLANDTDSVLQALKTMNDKLSTADVVCDQVTFEWLQNDFSILLTTNTFTLNTASEEEMVEFLSYLGEVRQSDGIITVSYIPRVKYATLFLDRLENDKVIPGFEGRFPEAKNTDMNEP